MQKPNTDLQFSDFINFDFSASQNQGAMTGRSVQSCSNPSKTKRSLIKINHKKLPQDFFNFGAFQLNNQTQVKSHLSSNDITKQDNGFKQKNNLKGMWLPNFGDQILIGNESAVMFDEKDLKRIRNKYLKSPINTNQQCNSPIVPFKTINAITPCLSAGNDSPLADSSTFQWTFSKDMYRSISPTKQLLDKKQTHILKRGSSLKQKDLLERILTRSYQKRQRHQFSKEKARKILLSQNTRVHTQLPKIHQK